ncbi:MAG TPA: DNA gyrase inhibitor YacG [Phycisphaerales bacterium]|nr:DNA gyrase inhibitor YacG [Phycisphaerales bacterium]
MTYQCPICGKVIPSASTADDGKKHINAPFFPFCSERCRLVDLGAWLDERYKVCAEPGGESARDQQTPSDAD